MKKETANRKVKEDLRRRIIETAKTIFDEQLVKLTFGVVSARIPGTDRVMITPSGFSKAKVKTGELIVLDLEGNLVEGRLKPSVESKVHCYIHKHRPDVGAVIHTHSHIASGFACAQMPIPCVSTEQAFVLEGAVPVVEEYAMPGTQLEDEIAKIEKALRNAKAVLAQSHGVFVIGSTLKEALDNAIVFEDCARTALVSNLLGVTKELTSEQMRQLMELKQRYGQKRRE